MLARTGSNQFQCSITLLAASLLLVREIYGAQGENLAFSDHVNSSYIFSSSYKYTQHRQCGDIGLDQMLLINRSMCKSVLLTQLITLFFVLKLHAKLCSSEFS